MEGRLSSLISQAFRVLPTSRAKASAAGQSFPDPWNCAWVGTTGYYQERDTAGSRQPAPRQCEHFALACLPCIQPTLMYLRISVCCSPCRHFLFSLMESGFDAEMFCHFNKIIQTLQTLRSICSLKKNQSAFIIITVSYCLEKDFPAIT